MVENNWEGISDRFNILLPGGSFVFEETDKKISEVVERLSGGQFAGGTTIIADGNQSSGNEESEG